MNRILITITAVLLGSSMVAARSSKRGVSENEFRFVQQVEALAPGVSWYYNWGNTPHNSTADFDGMEYVPMCWNGNFNADAIREYVKSHSGVKYLLGFNEPNFTSQANMTPEQAAERWPQVQALAKELGLKLVAPALNYSPNTWQPVPWMDRFIELVGADAFDYLAVHSYGGTGVMQSLATEMHERYGKDVWVTEFCYWPGEGGYVAPATQISAMIEAVTWLEKTDWIHRYAWFKAAGSSSSSSGPNYGLLLPGKGDDVRELSEQGYVYVYMSDFNPDVYHPVNTAIPASEYISAEKISLGKGTNPNNKVPLDISQFNSGATLDYQFDIPASGGYTLVLTVSGEGEPTRFNPCIGIFSVDADGKETALCDQSQFSLPNSNDTYIDRNFNITLEAGRQTIRIKDIYQFQPSGIRISSIGIFDTSGVEVPVQDGSCGEPVWYNMQGIRIANPEKGGVYLKIKDGVVSKVIY